MAWRARQAEQAGAALAEPVGIASAPIVPPAPSEPGKPPPPAPPAGSYPSEEARSRAALDKFLAVANAYSGTAAAVTARYRAAAILAELGRNAEAEREFKAVVDAAGSSVYGRMARLGLAEIQVRAGQYEPAISTYRELSSRADDDLPVDGVLWQLGRTYALAGRKAEALQVYRRIVDEFPESLYVADARREVAAMSASGAPQG
jgi:TolA-binding protein